MYTWPLQKAAALEYILLPYKLSSQLLLGEVTTRDLYVLKTLR